jgi:hypothetical protein
MAEYVANWQDERDGAALYRSISEVEPNPQLKRVLSGFVPVGNAGGRR